MKSFCSQALEIELTAIFKVSTSSINCSYEALKVYGFMAPSLVAYLIVMRYISFETLKRCFEAIVCDIYHSISTILSKFILELSFVSNKSLSGDSA